jgi:hypothetical protein
MATDATHELESLHRFVGHQLSNGRRGLSPEECLDLWRAVHPDEGGLEVDDEALKEALAEMEAGDTGQPPVKRADIEYVPAPG